MGGIGKTTIAEALFKRHSSQYQGCGFVENVREKWKQHGKYEVRNNLLTQILEGQMYIESRLQHRKVLIVLDDVSDSQQMDYLVGEKSWYGSGSRIIVTSRNKNVLQKENSTIYEVMPLNNVESLQLFCWKTFQQDYPKNEFIHLSKMVVDYAGGIPLVIVVLGSLLYSKNQEEWEGTLKKLEKVPNAKIHHVLRLSYEDLDYQEKEIFLDIACCLKGEKKGNIIDLLDGCSSSVITGLRNLQDKSLITISDNEYAQMHDLIQDMGWHIVRQESIKQPEKRSRLWDPDDIYHVLKQKMAKDHPIESISLNTSEIKEMQISPETFAKMPRLRLLKFYTSVYSYKCNMNISRGLDCLPDCLRYLGWDYFPLHALPQSFCSEMLVEIHLKNSSIKKLWDGDQDVANMKTLCLQGCHSLIELPCLKQATKLKKINLGSCKSLHRVPSYILSLNNLFQVNLADCTQLRSIQCDKPSESLQVLILSRCFNLVEFSVASEKLKVLLLDETAIEELSLSAEQLTNLTTLCLRSCKRHKALPNNLYQFISSLCSDNCLRHEKLPPIFADKTLSIKRLNLNYYSRFSRLPENLGHLSTLVELSLEGTGVETLPASIKLLHHLITLDVRYCNRLRSLSELPPMLCFLHASGCISLEIVPSIAPTTPMKKCFGGKNMSSRPRQNQEPTTSHDNGHYWEGFNFMNCSKLDKNTCKTILGEASMRIKYAAYVSSMVKASIDPYHQLYLCSEASNVESFYYTCCLHFLKGIARKYPNWSKIENEVSSTFTANFNGISGGDLRRLVSALKLNMEKNTDLNFDTSMQRICIQHGFPIPILRYSQKWNIYTVFCLPGQRIPRWIGYRTTQKPFIVNFQLPPSSHLIGFALCFILTKGYSSYKIRCECYLEDVEGNKTSESDYFSTPNRSLLDNVFLYYAARFTRVLEKVKEIKAIDQCSTSNLKLSFQFCLISIDGQDLDALKECGVWPIYASDLETEAPMESVKLRVNPKRRKLKKKRNPFLWNCRWHALIIKMKMSKRNRINLSSSSRTKARMTKILDEQQQHLPLRKKSQRYPDIDELGGGKISGIDKQDKLQPLHQTKKLKKRKRNSNNIPITHA